MERYDIEAPAMLRFSVMAESESEAMTQAFDEDIKNARIVSVDYAHAEVC